MSLAILAITSAITAGPSMPFPSVELGGENQSRFLATMRPYPAGRADDVRRPGFNGRLWIGDINIGPVNQSWPMAFGDPGPTSYGAAGHEFDRVYAKIGHTAVGISPWVAFNAEGLHDFEYARNTWLAERGFVGGVRTFVNDLYLGEWLGVPTETAKMGSKTQPRGTIQLPEDMPRFKSREQVMHEAGTVSKIAIGKVSLPPMGVVAMTEGRVANPAHQAARAGRSLRQSRLAWRKSR